MCPISFIVICLLARALGTVVILLIVLFIACPLIWSRDPGRRARSREALQLLTGLLAGAKPSELP